MGTFERPNILVVDDDEANLFLLQSILKILEVNLILALSGEEALVKIENKEIALALLDIQMSGMNGAELAKAIQNDSTRDIVPIIFITGLTDNEREQEKYYESGAVDFIRKPVRRTILLSKVRIFLELFRQKQIILTDHLELEKASIELARINQTLIESESNFRAFFETIDDLIFVASPDGNILFSNPALSEKSGYSLDELKEMKVLDLIQDDKRIEAEESFNASLKGEIAGCSLSVKSKSKVLIPAEMRVWIGRWNNVDCIFGFLKDLSIEQEAQQRFEHLFRNNPALMALSTISDQKFVDVNNAFLKRLGYTREEIIGKSTAELGIFPFPDQHTEAAARLAAKGSILNLELQVRHKNGEILDGIFSGEVIRSRGQSYFLTVMIDISKRKNIEAKLNDSLSILKKSQEISKVGSWQMNLGTGVVLWSDELYKIFGIERAGPDENMLHAFVSAIYPEDREKVENTLAENLHKGIPSPLEYRIVRTDGSIRWVYTKGEAQTDKHGQVFAQLGILQDLTEQKQTEIALKASESMYRTLLNASPEGIIIMDTNGIITEVSDITHEILGTENKKDFVGIHFFNFIPQEELKKFREVLHRTLIEGLVQNVEIILSRKNSSRIMCELSTTLIQELNGEPKSYMAVIRDISQRKKIERQLIRSERMISLGEMASAMAHEINQPLLSISLGIDNIFNRIEKLKILDESYFRDKSGKIFEDIVRIERIINHVRAFSRDQDNYIATSFSLNDSIKNAISLISEQFKNQNIKIIERLDKKLVPIIGNTYRFEQVILNLLTNAKDALEEKAKKSKGDLEKIITIITYQNFDKIYVEVRDNGSGIESDIIDRIMLPFYTTKETGKGTGLGLSISFGIIKEMNGTIDIESNPFTGSIFKISIPLNKSNEETKPRSLIKQKNE